MTFISIGPTQKKKRHTQAGPKIQPPPQEEVGKFSHHYYYYDPMFSLKKMLAITFK
jgi:hypothetical protein